LTQVAIGPLALLLGLGLGSAARAQSSADATPPSDPVCEQAGHQAERDHALPSGMLLAIGRVESGRWDPAQARVVPWPWALDANGAGTLFDSKVEAVARTEALRAAGMPNIDVGCFQIDLTSHPGAFATLEQAFDPFANADYAGRFLAGLYARTGTWDNAVAAYHSMQPDRGTAYRQRVFADWASKDHIAAPAQAHGPTIVQFASGARMRIWTPGTVANAVDGIASLSDSTASLPHVIVGRPYAP
jgi:hypothetical protein